MRKKNKKELFLIFLLSKKKIIFYLLYPYKFYIFIYYRILINIFNLKLSKKQGFQNLIHQKIFVGYDI
jgi:hypothetical protein